MHWPGTGTLAATVVEWYAARVLYRVSACAERLRAGSKPSNEYELFLVSRCELALIDIVTLLERLNETGNVTHHQDEICSC
ncbi:hypothetical protein FHG87_018989 [Trinorchestia longiramus]|nr:hypothetical protein FHG87_018989 [Trinorchestia longiramus]